MKVNGVAINGIVKTISAEGRVLIPADYRNILNLDMESKISLLTYDNFLILGKPEQFRVNGLISILRSGGRIIIPQLFRQEHNLIKNSKIEFVVLNDVLVIAPFNTEISRELYKEIEMLKI